VGIDEQLSGWKVYAKKGIYSCALLIIEYAEGHLLHIS